MDRKQRKLLVDLWQEQQCLYALNLPEYYDKTRKLAALNGIATELSINGECRALSLVGLFRYSKFQFKVKHTPIY